MRSGDLRPEVGRQPTQGRGLGAEGAGEEPVPRVLSRMPGGGGMAASRVARWSVAVAQVRSSAGQPGAVGIGLMAQGFSF